MIYTCTNKNITIVILKRSKTLCSAYRGPKRDPLQIALPNGESITKNTDSYLLGEMIMGIFGNDKEQDARIDALESHVRAISEAIQQTQLDVMKVNISLIRTESVLGEKVSSADVDPGIVVLNEQLGVARQEYEKMSAAAEESWTTLHAGASDALATLRSSVEEAAARVQQEQRD